MDVQKRHNRRKTLSCTQLIGDILFVLKKGFDFADLRQIQYANTPIFFRRFVKTHGWDYDYIMILMLIVQRTFGVCQSLDELRHRVRQHLALRLRRGPIDAGGARVVVWQEFLGVRLDQRLPAAINSTN